MESVPIGTDSPPLPFVHPLRSGCRSSGDIHGIRSHRNGFPFPIVSASPPFRLPQLRQRTTGKTVPKDGLFHERPLAAKDCASCGMRFYFLFGLKPGSDTGFQRGVPDSAESGQPARLDRAGSQTRTRLSPAGGIGASKSLGGIPYPLTVPFSTWNTVPAWNRAAVSSSQHVIMT